MWASGQQNPAFDVQRAKVTLSGSFCSTKRQAMVDEVVGI